MKTLQFTTNIDCVANLQKAVCGLACLHGRYCKLSVDLMETTHLLTLVTESLIAKEVIDALQREGVRCRAIGNDQR